MLPLETKQSWGEILPLSDLRGGGVSRGASSNRKREVLLQSGRNAPLTKLSEPDPLAQGQGHGGFEVDWCVWTECGCHQGVWGHPHGKNSEQWALYRELWGRRLAGRRFGRRQRGVWQTESAHYFFQIIVSDCCITTCISGQWTCDPVDQPTFLNFYFFLLFHFFLNFL